MARTMAKAKSAYIGRSGESVEINDQTYSVVAHWAEVDGRAVCVGLDIRSFTSKNASLADLSDAKPLGAWSEVDSETVRGFRVAQQIELSRQDLLGLLLSRFGHKKSATRSVLERKPAKAKRGPPSQWTEDVLRRVVIPAIAMAPKRAKVEAVRAALMADRGGEFVSPHMAKHGIRAANRLLQPPTSRGTQK